MIALLKRDLALSVRAGGGFVSRPQSVEADIRAGQTQEVKVAMPITAAPKAHGWYSADLHHHSDVLDGFTDPEYVLRSELAAGVDVAFLSDHDSVVNNEEMRRLAAALIPIVGFVVFVFATAATGVLVSGTALTIKTFLSQLGLGAGP